MTEDEHIRLVEIGNQFWHEFSKLCGKYVSLMPKELEAETVMYLGDKTSIYGSQYDDFIDRTCKP